MNSLKDKVQKLVDERRKEGVMNYISQSYATTDSSAPIDQVLRAFATNSDQNFAVIVLESRSSRKLRGIIKRSDLGRDGATAEDIASKPIIAIRNSSSLGDALDLMNGGNSLGQRLESLPIVNDSETFVGVVTMEVVNKKIRESL